MKVDKFSTVDRIADNITEYKNFIKTKGVSDETLNSLTTESTSLAEAIASHYSSDTEGAVTFKANIENVLSKLGNNLTTEEEINMFVNQIRLTFNLPYFTCLTITKYNGPLVTKELIFGRCYEEARSNVIAKLTAEFSTSTDDDDDNDDSVTDGDTGE